MHLTKLTLDPRGSLARRDLSDAYEMHRTLARAFVPDQQSPPPRFLWRLETSGNDWSKPVLLVQSATEGKWSVLAALPDYLQKPAECKRLVLEQLIERGVPYRFRLQANPTVTRCGKRYGLVGEADQLAWLQRQSERHGFGLDAALVAASDLLSSRKGNTQIRVRRTCFEGVLQVQDGDAFNLALTTGIGPAKAFGCGLLSVARCR